MVLKLPSVRSLSKARSEGDLSENIANADMSASVTEISVSLRRASGMVAKPLRTKRKRASAERCLRPLGATIAMTTPDRKTSNCSGEGRIVACRFTKSQPGGHGDYWVSSPSGNCCTSLNFGGDDLIYLVDRVCAIVRDRSRHHGLGFFRGRPRAIRVRQLGKVSAHTHKSKVTVARIDHDALQIGAVGFAAIRPGTGA